SSNIQLDTGGNVALTGGLTTSGNIFSGGDIATSSMSLNVHTHLYNPGGGSPTPTQPGTAGSATVNVSATSANPEIAIDSAIAAPAFWTNIVPNHEPWARTFMQSYLNNTNHAV